MTKDSVLAALMQSDQFISGETLSRKLQISRAAVHQAVKTLRAEGYEIASVTNRGYRLISGPDRITAGALQAYLGKERMGRVLCFDSADSTNRRLQEAILQNPQTPHGLIAVANEQTAGRGRLGRSFASPRNMGIYLSLLIRPEAMIVNSPDALSPENPLSSPSSWTALTSRTAVAVCHAIATVYDIRPDIKWVNDLLLNGKKICGILTQMELESESNTIRDIIVGIGVNVQEQEEDFPEELRDIAGSLYMATGKKLPRSVLAAEMIRQLDCLFTTWTDPDAASFYLTEYRAHSLVPGHTIRVITPAGEKEALAVSIGDDFSLHVCYPDGSEDDLRGGEISVRFPQE